MYKRGKELLSIYKRIETNFKLEKEKHCDGESFSLRPYELVPQLKCRLENLIGELRWLSIV